MAEPLGEWRADAFGRHEHRYWDGTAWTEHVSDRGVTGIDPPVLSSGPVVYITRRNNGLAIASMVLGIVWVYWIGSILAVIFGHVALSQIAIGAIVVPVLVLLAMAKIREHDE